MDEKTLDYNLKEDDFLFVKLGMFKSYCEEVKYSPLSKEDIKRTEKAAELLKSEFIDNYAAPFDFYLTGACSSKKSTAADSGFDKIVYSYSMLYGDTFAQSEQSLLFYAEQLFGEAYQH